MDSILTSIKQQLGIASDVTAFDNEIILGINSALMHLEQLGVGPEDGLVIEDSSGMWSDLLNDDTSLESVKIYVYLRTRLVFDPPSTSYLIEAMERQIRELEWRIVVQKERVIDESE